MLSFLYNNMSIIIVLVVIFVVIGLYFVVKSMPAKVTKKKTEDKKPETKQEEKKKDEEIVTEPEVKPEIDEKTQNDDKKVEKADKKPKIVQIYKRQERTDTDKKEEKIDPIYNRNVEFVNVSKNVSKFKSFKEEENLEEKANDEFGFVTDAQDDCEFCDDKVKHFDHSRRMSDFVKDETSDDMFGSHISEKYLNINSDRHLNLDEEFQNKLFQMTEKMMSNSDVRIAPSDGDSDFDDSMSLDEELDDEVKINMKTALIADTYFNRKKKK